MCFTDLVPNDHHNFIVEMTLSRYHTIASEMWLESTYCEYFILKRNILHYFHLIHTIQAWLCKQYLQV